MTDALSRLRRALRIRAAVRDLALGVLDRAAAFGAAFGHHELGIRLVLRARLVLHANDLGYHVTGALDDDAISHSHIETAHLVEVVQRRAADRRAADDDRREPGDRCEHAGPSDVDLDVLDGGRRLLGREFERDRPLRAARDKTEALLIFDAVDLHDDAVGAVVEVVPLVAPRGDEGEHLVDVLGRLPVRIRPHAELAQTLEQLVLRLQVEPCGGVRPHRQVALRGRARIQLANGARRRVARIREERLAALRALPVGRLERGGRQIDLAADVDAARDLFAEGERDRLDRPQVRGHVLAHESVAARRPLHELPVLVGQVDREPVDLQLTDVADVLAAESLPDALIERAELRFVERVGEREHGARVLDRREAIRRRRADPLRRRIGGDQLRMLRLELLELAHQRVVRLVGDRRRIEDVVLVVRLLDPLAQLHSALFSGRCGHAAILAQSPVLASQRWPPPLRSPRSTCSSSPRSWTTRGPTASAVRTPGSSRRRTTDGPTSRSRAASWSGTPTTSRGGSAAGPRPKPRCARIHR